MFISIAILFIICGILLLLKAKKIPKKTRVHTIASVCAIAIIILGMILASFLLSGKVELPLH